MYTASQKKRENIAEYLLYMWQIEDIIRAFGLDIDNIEAGIIDKYTGLTAGQKRELRDWYESLIDMMRREDVIEKGHLQLNRNTVSDMADLHHRLMADARFAEYHTQYYKTLPYIVELRAKSGEEKPGEIETCLNALYGLLLLRLKGTDVSASTNEAVGEITKFMAMLAKYYRMDQNDELFKD